MEYKHSRSHKTVALKIIIANYSKQNSITVVYKKIPLCKKMSLGKKPFHKSFVSLVDKLNMIDFKIFNILKLIFTCESCGIYFQNRLMSVRFQLNWIFFIFYFDCFFKDWPVVCLLYFVLYLLDTLFSLFLEIIVRLIF